MPTNTEPDKNRRVGIDQED
ncbi:hypothetical protein LYNGBM3L_05610 [Moorena producens 3L]|uniref:Uncharacterized protein n=1 Tax=Moorena producens 3L TaxID=489825 RepID=F4XRY3_9CYAN|nr:hypothetical protein LYNGBM3L_05530 [Moorena producens 3L]EGJ32711.1 hypothetical protein LYNGBM3L_05610 [Moorena producens 3L]